MLFRTVFFDWIDSSQSLVNSGIELRLESNPVKLQIFESNSQRIAHLDKLQVGWNQTL